MEAVLRDPGLLGLQREGGATLARLRQEAGRLDFNPDVRYQHPGLSSPTFVPWPEGLELGHTRRALRTPKMGICRARLLCRGFGKIPVPSLLPLLQPWPSSARGRYQRTAPAQSRPPSSTFSDFLRHWAESLQGSICLSLKRTL